MQTTGGIAETILHLTPSVTLAAVGASTGPRDPAAALAYTVIDRVFRAPDAPFKPGLFASIDIANRYAASVGTVEGLRNVYVMPCAELTVQAVALDVLDGVAICVPARRSPVWSRVMVLHEVAHVLAGGPETHGPRWAGEFVRLVRAHLSVAAGNRLDWEFHRAGLRPQVCCGNLAVWPMAG